MKRIITILLAGAMILASATPAFAAETQAANPIAVTVQGDVSLLPDSTVIENDAAGIPDRQLYTLIKQTAGVGNKEPLTLGATRKLTSLTDGNCDIVSLKGISYCPNLISIEIFMPENNSTVGSINPLKDLGDIGTLTKLQNLKISCEPTGSGNLKDISALAKLSNLRNLTIQDMGVTDISSLKDLDNLETVNLSYNSIKDITALQKKASLTKLTINNNPVASLSPLAEDTALTDLNVSAANVTDISPLATLKNLKTLEATMNEIKNADAVGSMKALETVCLSENELTDAAPFAKLPAVKELVLNKNHIADITPLSSLTSLETLSLDNNELTDISPLVSLKETLNDLRVGNNKIDTTEEQLDAVMPTKLKKSMTKENYQKYLDLTVSSQRLEKNNVYYATIDEKNISENAVIELPLGFTQKITVNSALPVDKLSFVSGNGKVVQTHLFKSWKDGMSGEYGIYGIGAVGKTAGVYANGHRLFTVKLVARPFTSDTNMTVTRKVGQKYTFKVTVPKGQGKPSYTAGNGKIVATLAPSKPVTNKDGSVSYYFSYKCLRKGETGLYVTLHGNSYRIFTTVVK